MEVEQKFSLDDVMSVWRELLGLKDMVKPYITRAPGQNDTDRWIAGMPWLMIVPPRIEEELFFGVIDRISGVLRDMYPQLTEEVANGLDVLPEGHSERQAFLEGILKRIECKDGREDPFTSVPSTEMAGFFVGAAAKLFMRGYAGTVSAWVEDEKWQRGICPVCGSHPSFSEIEGERRVRYLYCDLCGTRWRYNRIGCPFCEKSDEEQKLLVLEGSQQYRVYLCENCRSYLKAVDARHSRPEDLLLENIKTMFIDLLLAREGYGNAACNGESTDATRGGKSLSGP
ncbi:MAG: formate dehydrogenase accessory protein FdhE [Bacillota bacterium]